MCFLFALEDVPLQLDWALKVLESNSMAKVVFQLTKDFRHLSQSEHNGGSLFSVFYNMTVGLCAGV